MDRSWRSRRLIVAAAITGCAADVGEAPAEPRALVDASAWHAVDPADDPFADRRRPDVACDPTGYYVEFYGPEPALEVDTALCNDITVEQPSLAAIAAGEQLLIRMWHYDLFSSVPGDGHAALAIDGEIVWSIDVPIPAASALVKQTVVIDHDVPAGTPIQYFVGNHGLNHWALIEVRAEAAAEG